MNLTQRIISLASRTVGMSNNEVPGVTRHRANAAVQKLVAKGQLHKATITPTEVRYFKHPGLRDAMQLRIDMLLRDLGKGARVHFDATGDVSVFEAAPCARDADREGPGRIPGGEPVITPATVFTRCPSFEPRYEPVPLPCVYGGNQRGRVTADAATGFRHERAGVAA